MTRTHTLVFIGGAVALSAVAAVIMACTHSKTETAQVIADEAIASHAHVKGDYAPVNYAKPGASVSFRHNYDRKTTAGEIESFQVFVRDRYDGGALSVEISSDGVNLRSPAQLSFNMQKDSDHVIDIELTGVSDGVHYLNFQAIAELSDNQFIRRSWGMAIYVGVTAPSGKISDQPAPDHSTSGGQIMMEAEEEIIPG